MSSHKPKPNITLSLTLSPSITPQQTTKPEENGLRLIQLLLTCAKHTSSGNLHRADDSLQQISQLSSISGDSIQRLATRFASALAVRLVKRWPGLYKSLINHNHTQHTKLLNSNLYSKRLFSQLFPFLSISYAIFTQMMSRIVIDEQVVHVIDLGSLDLKLWVPLIRTFSNLKVTHLRVTCVGPNKHQLDKLGQRLIKEARTLDMSFQFNSINGNIIDLNLDMLNVNSGEVLAFISILNLHVLLAQDDRVDAHFGPSNKSDTNVKDCKQLGQFLTMVRSLGPKLFLLVEQEADHNMNRLLDRFVEGLRYYSAIFDAIDSTFEANKGSEDRIVLEEMFGREIENIVASEGLERVERHERYGRWMVRFGQAGFKPVRIWVDPVEYGKQMVEAYGKEGYKMVHEGGSLIICWFDRPLYAISAWTS